MAAKRTALSDNSRESDVEEASPQDHLLETGVEGGDGKTYTVDDALRVMKWGRLQTLIICYAAFPWFFVGSIISAWPALLTAFARCAFKDKSWNLVLVGVVTFTGRALSAFLMGMMVDKFGRRITVNFNVFFGCYFFLLQSIAPSYGWLVFLLFWTGFSFGGAIGASTAYCMETLPPQHRQLAISILMFPFGLGGVAIITVTMFFFEIGLGWRVSCASLAAVAVLFGAVATRVPKSPHYLVSTQRLVEAELVLTRMVQQSKAALPAGKLVQSPVVRSEMANMNGSSWRLLCSPMKMLFVLLCSLTARAAADLLYQGFYFFTTALSTKFRHESNKCPPFATVDYINMLWSMSAELLSGFLAAVAMKFLSQRLMCFVLGTGLTLPLFLLLLPSLTLKESMALLFISRMFGTCLGLVSHIIYPEFFPSVVRGKATGLATVTSGIGYITAPVLIETLVEKHLSLGEVVLAAIGVLATTLFCILPDVSNKRVEDTLYTTKPTR